MLKPRSSTKNEIIINSLKSIRIDGVPNILLHDLLLFKLVWLLILMGSSCFCVYLIIGNINSFLQFKIATTYRLQSELTSAFPTIYMCNMNPFTSAYAVHLLSDANLTLESGKYQFVNILQLEYYMKQTTGSYLTVEQRKNLSDLDGLIISCVFLNKPCNMSDFQYEYLEDGYNCLKLTAFGSSPSSVGGKHGQLTMELYVGMPNELNTQIAERGAYIKILDQNEDPNKNSPTVISVTPHFGTSIKVARNFYHQFNEWPYAYSDCNVDETGEKCLLIKKN